MKNYIKHLFFILAISSVMIFASNNTAYAKLTADKLIIDSDAEFKNYAKETVSDYGSQSNEPVMETVLADCPTLKTYNYSQSSLNEIYNKKHKKTVDGTCTEVALSIAAEYLNRKNIFKIYTNDYSDIDNFYEYYFGSIVNSAIKTGLMLPSINGKYTYSGSSSSLSYQSTLSDYYRKKSFSSYDCIYSNSYTDKSDFIDTVKDSLKIKVPVIGNFDLKDYNHSMVICGVTRISVPYKSKNGKEKTYSADYYIVNDGWHTAKKGKNLTQYVPVKYCKNIRTIYSPIIK